MGELLEPTAGHVGGYRHEAFLYSGTAEFLAGVTSFLGPAAGAGDPVFAVLTGGKLAALRRQLDRAANVSFADMAEVGSNPARIIAVWRQFVDAHAGAAHLWGVGEPIYPGRSPAQIAECQLYESLLNVGFEASTPLRLLCPYDTASLPAEVIAEACRTHPFVTAGARRQPSSRFRPFDLTEAFSRPLPPRPQNAAALSFDFGGLRALRAFVAGQAVQAGMSQQPATALVTAVNEIATNSLQHGGGHGAAHIWSDGQSLLCEVSDGGQFTAPLAGRLPPGPGAGGGLWLANQLCDLVQICSSPGGGTIVRIHQRLDGQPAAGSARARNNGAPG